MADIVSNPAIPYSGNIPGGIFPSKTIYIQGYVPPNADRFSINLQNQNPQPDVALHFNPRFDGQSQCVVRNTKINQRWGAEERQQDDFPFRQGQNFEVIILCELTEFKIAVNGRHFATYNHRITNLQQVTSIYIAGKVHIYAIRYDPPAGGPMTVAQPLTYPFPPQSVNNPPVPYVAMIPGGIKDGKIIVVKVTVKPNPTRFHVNFQCGISTNPRSDVALQFNPRFRDQLINMNTLRSTKWDGNEEKHRTYFPFQPNGAYEIMFLCTHHEFKVALNGTHLLEYKHRLPFQNISAMAIEGDVTVTQITFN